MSSLEPDIQGTDPQSVPSDSPVVNQLMRYTIHVPVHDNDKKEIPHVLAALRDTLSKSGFPGRTIIRKTQGDWTGKETAYDTEDMDLVMVDAPDSPENLQAILDAAKGVKELAGQENIYVTTQPLSTYLV